MALLDTMETRQNQYSDDAQCTTLTDLCIGCVGNNLHSINRLGRYLITEHKHLLIKRLVDHDKFTPEYVPHITYNLFSPNIKHIEFSYSNQITDDILKQLGSCGAQLERIVLKNLPNITDAGILSITEKQYGLKYIVLKKVPVTKGGIANIKSHKLRYVEVRACPLINDEGIFKLVSQNPQIVHLNISHNHKMTTEVVPHVASHLGSNLEVLKLSDRHDLDDTSVQTLAQHCPNLKVLDIVSCNLVTAPAIAALFNNCRDLRSLDLSYCSPTVANNPVLKAIPENIDEISLCGCLVNNDRLLIDSISRLNKLRKLRLCGVPSLSDNVVEEILEAVGSHLDVLDLSGGMQDTLSDKSLKFVAQYCTDLKELALSLLSKITGHTLLPLFTDRARAAKIRGVLLASKNMNLEILQAVATNCHNVVKMDICGLGVVDDILLSTIADNCPKLTYLNLKGCGKITDVGVCDIARSCALKVVILSGVRQITDKSIILLANSCPYLEEVYLNGCYSVSRAAVHYLVDTCIPRVYWAHKIPNARPEMTMVKNLVTGEYQRADEM